MQDQLQSIRRRISREQKQTDGIFQECEGWRYLTNPRGWTLYHVEIGCNVEELIHGRDRFIRAATQQTENGLTKTKTNFKSMAPIERPKKY
jgi:hypothetical protein